MAAKNSAGILLTLRFNAIDLLSIFLQLSVFLLVAGDRAHAQFTTIINVPPTVIGNNVTINSNTQLNLSNGGAIGNSFQAGSNFGTSTNVQVNISGGTVGTDYYSHKGSTTNISGGVVGRELNAQTGSIVNISGGIVGHQAGAPVFGYLRARPGSTVNLSGGAVGGIEASFNSTTNISGGRLLGSLQTSTQSAVHLYGGDFRIDGVSINGLENVGDTVPFSWLVNGSPGRMFSGTLADGTPFAFTLMEGDLHNGSVTLHAAAVPAIGPALITASVDPIPRAIRDGQTLRVDAGGNLGDFFAAGRGSSLIVETGGSIGKQLEITGTNMTMSGGFVGDYWVVNSGSQVDISGGSVGNFAVNAGSVVNFSGGTNRGPVGVGIDSVLNFSGGRMAGFSAGNGATVNVSGGSASSSVRASSGSQVNFFGSEMRLNGVPISGLENVGDSLPFEVPADAVLSGTFADGSPFLYFGTNQDFAAQKAFDSGTLKLHSAAVPAVTPGVILASSGNLPFGVRNGQVLIVDSGGNVGERFHVGWGSSMVVQTGGVVGRVLDSIGATVAIQGGIVGDSMRALVGSTVNMTSGVLGNGFAAMNGSVVSISGGSIGNYFGCQEGSAVNILGGTFGYGFTSSGTVNMSGGSLGSTAVVGPGEFNLTGGSIDQSLRASYGSTVNIAGGTVAQNFRAEYGSSVNISGGSVGDNFRAEDGSVVNISGGEIGSTFEALPGSVLNISGGKVPSLGVRAGATLNATGGLFWGFQPLIGSTVQFSGAEMRLDGVLLDGLENSGDFVDFQLPLGSVLSGTLADGSPLYFYRPTKYPGEFGPIRLQTAELASDAPVTIVASTDPIPKSIRSGQTLIVDAGASIPTGFRAGWDATVIVEPGATIGKGFTVIGSTFTMTGGTFEREFAALMGSQVNILGGKMGDAFLADKGSTVNISGGDIGVYFTAREGSVVNISGGVFGAEYDWSGFQAEGGSIINVSGGEFGRSFAAYDDSVVKISGGSLDDGFEAHEGSSVHLFGTEFHLNGTPIAGLDLGETLVLTDRNQKLTGRLLDGTSFEFDLNSTQFYPMDFFSPAAILQLTLALPGDFNFNGIVDAADYTLWRNGLRSLYNQNHYALWKSNLGRTSGSGAGRLSVPEPSQGIFLLAGLIAATCRNRMRLLAA
jgi:hypothetical protein